MQMEGRPQKGGDQRQQEGMGVVGREGFRMNDGGRSCCHSRCAQEDLCLTQAGDRAGEMSKGIITFAVCICSPQFCHLIMRADGNKRCVHECVHLNK